MNTGFDHEEDIVILVNLKSHLVALEKAESEKPLNQQRPVPTVADLARALNINRATMYNWATNKYDSSRHDILQGVINALRRAGFPASVADLLKEHPASTVPALEGGEE